MALLFIVGVVLLGIGVALTVRAVVSTRLRIAGQVRQIDNYGFGQEAHDSQGVAIRSLPRLAERVGHSVIGLIPSLKPLERRELMAAGKYELSVEAFHGYRVLGSAGLTVMMLAFMIMGKSLSLVPVLLVLSIGFIAWYLPAAMVRTRGQRRLDVIDRELPELIDVLTVTVEAGLSVGGSLQLIADRFDGPLGDELRLTLQEQKMGMSTDVALKGFVERCDTPSVRAFVRAVLQGNSLGVSIGVMLRNTAAEARKRRRGLARERAQRAPVKLLFPLVFLIFPAMLIVLMYPTAYNIVQALGGR
jgi:tight adherence protein C